MTKPFLTIRATLTRDGAKPEVWEVDAHLPAKPTPQNVAAEIDDAFGKLREKIEQRVALSSRLFKEDN